jgi:hypothetical protein
VNLDLSKYKRIFAFGCSFTKWRYPTWANIVHQCAPNATMFNMGQSGAGNSFIANRMTQANRTYNFCESDLVIVMWSTLCREDRYINHVWRTVGNMYSQNEYSESFVKKYCDPLGYLIRDLSTIELATSYMKNLPCDYFDLLSAPFDYQILDKEDIVFKHVMHTYRDLISHFTLPTMHDVLKDFHEQLQYINYNGEVSIDYHPTPNHYCEYLRKINFPLTPTAIAYAEEAHSKAITVKHVNWFPVVFPELQNANAYSKYYSYQNQWNIEE